MIIGTSQKTETIRQDLKCSLSEHQTIHLGPLFKNFEDEIPVFSALYILTTFPDEPVPAVPSWCNVEVLRYEYCLF